MHFADDRLCVPSGHHHLSHSPIPVGQIFFLSYWVILTPTNTVSSEIPPNPQELGHSLEKLKMRPGLFSNSKPLPFHFCHQCQVATASCPLLVLSLHSNPMQQMTLCFLGWIYLCLKPPLQVLLEIALASHTHVPKWINSLLEMMFWNWSKMILFSCAALTQLAFWVIRLCPSSWGYRDKNPFEPTLFITLKQHHQERYCLELGLN